MGTANFKRLKDASKYYVLNDTDFIEAELDGILQHISNISLDNNELYFEGKNRLFDGCILYSYVDIGSTDQRFCIALDVVFEPGYYTGLKIDYTVKLFNDKIGELESRSEVLTYDYSELDESQAGNIANIVHMRVDRLSELLERKLDSIVDRKLTCVGRFSNGNAIYKTTK